MERENKGEEEYISCRGTGMNKGLKYYTSISLSFSKEMGTYFFFDLYSTITQQFRGRKTP